MSKSLEEQQTLLNSEEDVSVAIQRRKCRREDHFTILLIALALLSSTLVGALIGFTFSRLVPPSAESCTRSVISTSPLLQDIDITYSTVRFNGSLMKENVFRQQAGPEVDAAWESLGVNYRSVAIPLDRAKSAGLAADQVKINPKYGGGFPANVEGLHQLHCLNLLRQSLYYNFDYYHALGKGAFKNDDHILQLHVSHCLDILRQQLQCTIDIGVLGQVWYNSNPNHTTSAVISPKSFVDFNTVHKCRNFETVRRWAEQRQLPEHVPSDFLQPPDIEGGDRVYEGIP